MKIFAIIASIVTGLMLLVAFIGGVFDTVSFAIREAGPYNLVYKEHIGPYAGIRVTLNDVFKYVIKQNKERIKQGFAIFYDDPAEVPADSLRSIGGMITDSLLKVSAPYKSALFPKIKAVVGEFPIRSFLSYTSGTLKFYPQLQKRLSENQYELSGPVMEIYDSPRRVITYIAPINGGPSPAPQFGNGQNK
jgi:effector-binding domain-containing protein